MRRGVEGCSRWAGWEAGWHWESGWEHAGYVVVWDWPNGAVSVLGRLGGAVMGRYAGAPSFAGIGVWIVAGRSNVLLPAPDRAYRKIL